MHPNGTKIRNKLLKSSYSAETVKNKQEEVTPQAELLSVRDSVKI